MNKPLLVYGDDNGSCSLYNLTLAEYNRLRADINDAEDEGDDEKLAMAERAIESARVNITSYENGYVPDYVVELSKIYGFDTDSN